MAFRPIRLLLAVSYTLIIRWDTWSTPDWYLALHIDLVDVTGKYLSGDLLLVDTWLEGRTDVELLSVQLRDYA